MTLLEFLHKRVSVRVNVLAGHPMSHVIADRFADVIKFTVAAQRRGDETQKSETIDPKQGLRHEVPRADKSNVKICATTPMATGKSTRTDPGYCTRYRQPSRSDRFRSNGIFDAWPLGPKYTCSSYCDILGNEDRDGLIAARRRTLHPTFSTSSGTSRKSLIF